MPEAGFPEGFRIETLSRTHDRGRFDCGVPEVNQWLASKARQSQEKNLSVTRVLVAPAQIIAGYYTLAYGQLNLDQLPPDIARKLPGHPLPVVVLAWLGVDQAFRGQGFGESLFAHALARCLDAMHAVPYVAVIVDCLNEAAKGFFLRYQFRECPGHPMKLLLPRALLEAMASTPPGA